MAKENINSKKGFTIIEVVLVLAIAGLIFLMVFIALPAMQRNQRDTQRRNDYSMLSSAVTSYSSSNGGKIYKLAGADKLSASKCTTAPGALSAAVPKTAINPATYINKEGTDPNGYRYQLRACTYTGWNALGTSKTPTVSKDASGNVIGDQVFVVIGADCTGTENGHDAPKKNDSARAFAIYGYVESGNQTYCASSQ